MYHLIAKPDGSFQIQDDDGENYGVYGDRDEAQEALDALNKTHKKIVGVPEKKAEPKPEAPKIQYPGVKTLKKAFTQPIKKSPVVKRSPLKAKRGRPKKSR